MNKTTEPANETLNTQAEALAKKLQGEIEKAGFTVKLSPRNLGTAWPSWRLQIEHKTPDLLNRWVEVAVVAKDSWSRTPVKVQVAYERGAGYMRGRGSNFSRKQRYTVLDGIVERIMKNLAEDLALAQQYAASRLASQNAHQRAVEQRQRELKGVVLPPGMKAQVVEGDGPGAGLYAVSFERHSGSLLDTYLTAEQTKELVALLNRFQKTEELYVIRAQHKDESGENVVVRFWKHQDWLSFSYNGPDTFTRQEAEAQLAKAKGAAGAFWGGTVEIVAYKDIAAIPESWPINV